MTTPIEKLLDNIEWKRSDKSDLSHDDNLPYVTHSGVLKIDTIELKCYTLSDGRRIFDADDINNLFPGWQELMAKSNSL